MAASIFLSYRREDSAATCGRVFDRLVARVGHGAVFKDVDSIPAGVDYRVHVNGILDQCALQLVVIGARWLSVTDASGARRLDQPNDLVRLEIEAALRRNISIIPLLVDGASMPTDPQLPVTLQPLAYRNALPVRYDPDFDKDVARLIEAIERLIPTLAAPAASPPVLSVPQTSQAAPAPGLQIWDATQHGDYVRTRPKMTTSHEGYVKTIAIGSHRIDVQALTYWGGHQLVFYDGTQVGAGTKATKFGHKTYSFTVNEDGRDLHYQVDVGMTVGWSVKADVRIRRNGVEIYRD